MPPRRTSPRRTATRPSALDDRPTDSTFEDDVPGDRFAGAAPWLALLAVVLAAGALAFTLVGRGSADLTACRSAAWAAVPDANALPAGWSIGSTDLNANGLTVSIVGQGTDASTQPPVVYASVTCYGDGAGTALQQNRKGAEAAGATVTDRTANGEAYDVDNPSTQSVTTLFRVGGLVGQVADGGTAPPSDLAAITKAVASAMGDQSAAGTTALAPTDIPGSSGAPSGSDAPSDEPAASAFAPELEAVLPTEIGGAPLTIQSNSAAEVFGDDPSSRALGARIRTLGSTLDQLRIAQAYDDTGGIAASIVAFRLPNADGAKLKAAIEETWLSSKNAGVTTTTVTLGGKNLTKVDYGDAGTIEYVYAKDDYVVVIDTSDVAIVTEVASKLK
jgi:hypothetical protein